MTRKSILKRIALVATIGLGASALAVLPAANAAAPNDIAVGDLGLTTTTATIGVCAVDTSVAGAAYVAMVPGKTFTLTVGAGGSGEKIYVGVSGSVKITAATGFDTADETKAYSVTDNAGELDYAQTGDTIDLISTVVGDGAVTVRSTATGSAVEIITFEVVASCANNTYDPTYSAVQIRNDDDGATGNVDVPGAYIVANGGTGYINLALTDVYGNDLSGTGSLVASATNGAVVSWDAAATVQSSTAMSTGVGATGTELYVVQGTANKDKPLTTTVTITLNGTNVGTKTLVFTGIATTIDVKDVTVGKVGSVGYFRVKVLDAAGNALPSKTVTGDGARNAAPATAEIIAHSANATSSATGDWSATGQGQFLCLKSGTATYNLKHVTSAVSGANIKKAVTVACGGALDTWTISLDKAVYAPGEIATLTVAGKDSKGFPVNTNDLMGTAGVAIDQTFGGMTFVTAPTGSDVFSSGAGVKTYTLSVGGTEGSFVGSFKITGATDTKAKTVQYKIVAPSTGAVSNAEVLSAIVKLIASINEQIALLQKQLAKATKKK